ncbi:hypothetical protein [Propionibacterium acidifaciens]|uniref:hypothetical protein n=1 Tax=Propionibacterium acidifaciens TaxID=556499 RepID=UPI0023EF870B|nr:hypothetical protein [Propionibacterium acidifaciens]
MNETRTPSDGRPRGNNKQEAPITVTFDDLPPRSPILEIDEEIEAIHGLMSMPLDYLKEHFVEFHDYAIFMIMPCGSAVYTDITPENEGEFFKFADWLDEVYPKLGKPRLAGSAAFRLSYDSLTEEYPDLKR